MKTTSILSFVLLAIMASCILPKEVRLLNKETKYWRESPVVLKAYMDTPLSGLFLVLRKNGKFEQTASGIFKGFETGNWMNILDTIHLSYIDIDRQVKKNQRVFIDRKTSTLEFEGDTNPIFMRYRISVTKW